MTLTFEAYNLTLPVSAWNIVLNICRSKVFRFESYCPDTTEKHT